MVAVEEDEERKKGTDLIRIKKESLFYFLHFIQGPNWSPGYPEDRETSLKPLSLFLSLSLMMAIL